MNTESRNLRLRPLTLSDAQRIVSWLSTPEVAFNLGLTKQPTLEYTLRWIENASKDDTILANAIEVDGDHVGNIVLDQIDAVIRKARLSIFIAPPVQGRGIAKFAVRETLKVAFRDKQLNKVWLTTHTRNVRAISAFLKCGFVIEGVLRQEFFVNGSLVDCFYMGIVRNDWEQLAK